ncbi:MAG: AMP-dependent synthetase/ligase [Acidimicrobiales bacterium]
MTLVEERSTTPAPSEAATNLPALLLRHARERPDAVALREKQLGRWVETTWTHYADRVASVAAGLAELGVQRGDKVAVHADNRIEWLVADLAIQGLGAVTVGVYPTSPAAELEYLLDHSESVVLISEDEEQLDKALEVRGELSRLRSIVVMDTRGVTAALDDPQISTFADLEATGSGAPDASERFDRLVAEIDAEDTAIIVYTSGTTGPAKGALLSHRNLLAVAEGASGVYDAGPDDEVLSYLPLCHIAERLFSVINALYIGYVVNFGEGGESFTNDLREVQPTFFLGVPRVWEKMLAGIQIRVNDATWLKRKMHTFWVAQGQRVATRQMQGQRTPLDRVIAGFGWLFLYRSLREKLGMARMRVPLSGAAPIAPQVLEFFWSIGVRVREGYGQTENTALCTYTPEDDVRLGTVGKALPGVELRIADDGEILTRSAGVFQGYFKNPEATQETIDDDGWLHTGDVGVLEDGFLTITDRKKDIIITAGGKNISPSQIENLLKVSPYIREAIVIGDRRKYLTALIGIELDTVGDWATRNDVRFTTYRDLTEKPEVAELIQGAVDETNTSFARVETIKHFALLSKELDSEDGELTATQKVKRAAISSEFEDVIEAMYR